MIHLVQYKTFRIKIDKVTRTAEPGEITYSRFWVADEAGPLEEINKLFFQTGQLSSHAGIKVAYNGWDQPPTHEVTIDMGMAYRGWKPISVRVQ